MFRIVIAITAVLAIGLPARANDSMAELAAGGLILKKTSDIEMQSEDLFISASNVRVTYRFFNAAPHDISAVVAFPLPDITVEQDSNVSVPAPGADNFLDFSTFVDGKRMAMTLEQKVLARGVDQTQRLRNLKVPLSPFVAGEALDRLPPGTQEELLAVGLVEEQQYDAGKGMERHLAPLWTFKTTYYWTQVFPAGKTLSVEHTYAPSLGGSVGGMVGAPTMDAETLNYYQTRYCIEPSFIAAARAKNNAFTEEWISYVLTTGANWSKPIGTFTLTVDKGAVDNLVSFCAEDVKKTGPTTFQSTRRNYTPTADLSVLILTGTRMED